MAKYFIKSSSSVGEKLPSTVSKRGRFLSFPLERRKMDGTSRKAARVAHATMSAGSVHCATPEAATALRQAGNLRLGATITAGWRRLCICIRSEEHTAEHH